MKGNDNSRKIKEKPKVGIFFFVDGALIIDAVAISKGEAYGDAIQYGSHYEFWERLRPGTLAERKFKSRAYDAYPRGRVIYFPEKGKYFVYHDTCLKLNKELKIVAEKFGLEHHDIKHTKDEHYKCARCNPHFMD